MEQPEPKRSRVWGVVYCPHCDQEVSKTTFYRHRKSFYCKETNSWSTGADNCSSTDCSTSDEAPDPEAPDSDVEGPFFSEVPDGALENSSAGKTASTLAMQLNIGRKG